MNKATTATSVTAQERFRPLKWDERVRRGDFVEDGHLGFEPWEGPAGFRADTFVKQIYRRLRNRPASSAKATA
jgi:hypothetical protein